MTQFPFTTFADTQPRLGLVVLQTDETLEDELRTILPGPVRLNITRIPSAPEVTRDTLAQMAGHLTDAVRLLPEAARFHTIGYGCTSGTAQIGVTQIAGLVQAGAQTQSVTEPVSALLAACSVLGLRRLAFLSPYIEPVSDHLRAVLAHHAVDTPVFGTFAEANETTVAHIDADSVRGAALALCAGTNVDGLFLSCTNLRSFSVLPDLQRELGIPVLSSNLVLGWHMLRLSGAIHADMMPGDLLR